MCDKTALCLTNNKPSFSNNTNRVVTYMYADAFTLCDCGAELMLTLRGYESNLYEGGCLECGKKYQLRLNKLREVK
jgi:hypothetical protein